MHNLKKKISILCILASILSIILMFNSNLFRNPFIESNNNNEDLGFKNHDLKISDNNNYLFQGIEKHLNLTDKGNLYNFDQEVSASNQEELNLTYYLDEDHDWKISKIQTSIENIQDTRNWINNSEFKSPTIFRKYQVSETPHNYTSNHNFGDIVDTITEPGASFIRAHFVNLGFERRYDFFYVLNSSNDKYLITDCNENRSDVYSPWIPGDTMKFTYISDGSLEYYGYYMDYYEFINSSSNYEINSDTWGFNYIENGVSDTNVYGAGEIKNATGMYVGLYGEHIYDNKSRYKTGAYSELYQNISVPRGSIIDAYLTFDYNVPFGLDTNDNYIYFEINKQKVYSKGMSEIIRTGKGIWHHTGEEYMESWENTSNVFESILNGQKLNISVGIKCGKGITYTNFEEGYQNIVWFDNVSLVLTTIANSSQLDINFTINNNILVENDKWGSSSLTMSDDWHENPVVLTINTTSPSLQCDLNTTLYGYHNGTTKIDQLNTEGISYRILNNGSIYWEFYHNLYMPSQYSDFEFIINKPVNWEIISVFDPTLELKDFEGGGIGDNYVKINKTNALFPGWWKFVANSPNYLNISNTKMFKLGQWVHTEFYSGEYTKIKTQVNYSNEIPNNLDSTIVNLTIYDPQGSIWHEETKIPLLNGTFISSKIYFDALNTTGGLYNYTLFWSNGTVLGGLKSNFLLIHNTSITLLKPDDAILDLRTEGFMGDIIPVRILLRDSENNLTISNSNISFTWTNGICYFTESALGIYETIIDTSDLPTSGLYSIDIKSLKVGFFESNITLKINLREKTDLMVLESEYNIELHANSTIKFKFSDFNGDGIDGATVNVDIINKAFYSITNPGNGTYIIEFSTLFIENTGIYQLNFEFSAINYEPQFYTYQFQIIEQSVNLYVYVNSQSVNENSVLEATFNEKINISTKAMSNIDKNYLSGGVITLVCGDYQKNLTEYSNYWFNTSIMCSQEIFSFGDNYVYLKFQHQNYRTETFGFQFLINQIEIDVEPISFEDFISVFVGETVEIQIKLIDHLSNNSIENASVSYSWEFGIGTFTKMGSGIYQTSINLPENIQGNYRINLIITPEDTMYKTTQCSFILAIGVDEDKNSLNFLILIIIIISILVLVISVLGFLSLRSYVLLPRRRKRDSELLAKTQKFKDLDNIQAIVLIHKGSGIPFYTKSYSTLKKHQKELFAGFIHAITTIGQEFSETISASSKEEISIQSYGVEKILELDFKYFYCLIADKEVIRLVFILKEKSSQRLKVQMAELLNYLSLKLSEELETWDGNLDEYEEKLPIMINKYFELYYKEPFRLSDNYFKFIKKRKEKVFTRMENQVLNIIQSLKVIQSTQSIVKSKKIVFHLNTILDLVGKQNKDLVIEAIESLIEKKVIAPIL